MQDCRKYKKDNWLGVEDERQIDRIMKELAIESQPHFSSKLCREIHKHTKVGKFLGFSVKGIRKDIRMKTIMSMSELWLST